MVIKVFAFDVPHIIDKVAGYLSLHELAQCVLVSKDWNVWFIPALWKNIDMKKPSKPTFHDSLQKHRDFVQSINYLDKNLLTIYPLPSFPNLTTLVYSSMNCTVEQDEAVHRFVKSTPSINNLTLLQFTINESSVSQLMNSIESLTNLSRIDLTIYKNIPIQSILQLIEISSRCKFVRLLIGQLQGRQNTVVESDRLELEKARSEIELMKPTNIQELSIAFPDTATGSAILIPLLEKSPLLKHLGLEYNYSSGIYLDISEVLNAGNCPLLDSLRVGAVTIYNTRKDELAELIRSFNMSHSTPNHGGTGKYDDYSDDSMDKRKGLRSFVLNSSTKFPDLCIDALINHHANTLVSVEVMEITQGSLHLLCALPHLQSFKGVYWLKSRAQAEEFGPEGIFKLDWKCTGLRKLEIGLQVSELMREAMDAEDSSVLLVGDIVLKYVFTQIGNLKELSKWRLICWGNLLSIEKGYLNLLTQLKKLKYLDLRRCPDIIWGAAEAQWMIENWTGLVELKFYTRKKRGAVLSEDDPLYEAKNVILARRPFMSIIP